MPRDKIGRIVVCCFALFVVGVVQSVALLCHIDGATLKLFYTFAGGVVGFLISRIFPGKKKGDHNG